MNKSLYITAIVGNFILLVYAAVLIVGISGGWLDGKLWLHSDVAKVAQLLLMASAMGCHRRTLQHQSRHAYHTGNQRRTGT